MNAQPAEVEKVHTRLLKCTLEVDESRAYWQATPSNGSGTSAQLAFDEYWFGAKSLQRVKVLLTNMRARYDAFSPALDVLRRWNHMDPDTRRTICHWHLQLSDPLYRVFTGELLVARRDSLQPMVTHNFVVKWVGQQVPDRWTMTTQIQFASKLLSSAFSAGLVGTIKDPRPLLVPRVDDEALTYFLCLCLLRSTRFEGSLLNNPYLASVGLDGSVLEDRLRGLDAVAFSRQDGVIHWEWRDAGLVEWASRTVATVLNSEQGPHD